MKLPDNSIGITDLISYRECARRMSYGLKRHVGVGMQEEATATPEKSSGAAAPAATYGSAIHEAIALSEDGYSDDDAISGAWRKHGRILLPEDLVLLREDLARYHERDFPGMRTVMSEDEVRIPLLEHNGEQIYFRGKIDRLYQNLSAPGTFVHVDYKSSKWPKTEPELAADLQMWAYAWAIRVRHPECDHLIQIYDQLRFGQMTVPVKSDLQLQHIHGWLIEQVTALLEDEDYGPDGLLQPTFNDWCPWCPIINDCPVVDELSDYARTRIAALHPRTPKPKKDGTPGKQWTNKPLDPERWREYAAQLRKAKVAQMTLERFDNSVRDLLRELPENQRQEVGYTLRSRTNVVFGESAKAGIAEELGDRFFRVATVTQEGLKREVGDDSALMEHLLGMADKVQGTPAVVRKLT